MDIGVLNRIFGTLVPSHGNKSFIEESGEAGWEDFDCG